jgi:hypothetical protein
MDGELVPTVALALPQCRIGELLPTTHGRVTAGDRRIFVA